MLPCCCTSSESATRVPAPVGKLDGLPAPRDQKLDLTFFVFAERAAFFLEQLLERVELHDAARLLEPLLQLVEQRRVLAAQLLDEGERDAVNGARSELADRVLMLRRRIPLVFCE